MPLSRERKTEMRSLLRLIAILILPLALTSCFLIPGAFTSSLDLRKDGRFTFAYQGEIIFQSPGLISGT